nr:uncharacterized protein LOC129266168 [Lytechinus pictus]
MDEESHLSIDEIRLWNMQQLKNFVRERNLPVSRRKEELVALVFAAKVSPHLAPVVTSPAEAAAEKTTAYADLLKIPTGSLPDPNSLENWIGEKDGITKWPQTMAFDIGKYLQSIDNVDLRSRLESDYKDGKSYSYFASGWLGEVYLHEIDPSVEFCFLKAKCRPSQRIRDTPWNVWVSINKKTGWVQSAYCTCFAGFGSSCNHVAALLFKIDYAWRQGLTNPACTSRECEWSAFSGRTTVEPKRLCEMTWKSPKFSTQAGLERHNGINPAARQLFSPVGSRSEDQPANISELSASLRSTFQDSCVFQYIDSPDHDIQQNGETEIHADINVQHEEKVVASDFPMPLLDVGKSSSTITEFLEAVPKSYSTQSVEALELETRGQATSTTWIEHRKGRVTGSVAHAVLTKERTREGKPDTDTSALLKRVMGYEKPDMAIPALKYGREMEDEARRAFFTESKEHHSRLSVRECGMFVDRNNPYIAASPDGIVECNCCGRGVLEIKCPYNVAHTAPTADNVPYLIRKDGKIDLKENHPYYSQVQLEMGVTKTRYCDFFVYSRKGQMTVRVYADEERWDELVKRSTTFFRDCVAKEIVEKKIMNEFEH